MPTSRDVPDKPWRPFLAQIPLRQLLSGKFPETSRPGKLA